MKTNWKYEKLQKHLATTYENLVACGKKRFLYQLSITFLVRVLYVWLLEAKNNLLTFVTK